LKINCNQKYTTDSVSAAILKEIASKKWTKIEVNETDLPWSPTSGSHIAPQVSDPAPV
jgi:aspartyl aminopeptidase